MKKEHMKYEFPEIEFIYFTHEDVIVTSNTDSGTYTKTFVTDQNPGSEFDINQ